MSQALVSVINHKVRSASPTRLSTASAVVRRDSHAALSKLEPLPAASGVPCLLGGSKNVFHEYTKLNNKIHEVFRLCCCCVCLCTDVHFCTCICSALYVYTGLFYHSNFLILQLNKLNSKNKSTLWWCHLNSF